jgi:hypothetical protein
MEQNVTAMGHLFYLVWPHNLQSFSVVDLGNAKLTQCLITQYAIKMWEERELYTHQAFAQSFKYST